MEKWDGTELSRSDVLWSINFDEGDKVVQQLKNIFLTNGIKFFKTDDRDG